MSTQPASSPAIPAAVTDLQAIYGPASQAGFGSAVFYEGCDSLQDIEWAAQKYYRYFVGDLWDRFGEATWMNPWKEVYRRPAGATRQIVTELRSISDTDAALSVPMILETIDNPEAAQNALAAVYDAPDVIELAIYNLGDGAAMSGILLAGRSISGATTFLIFLYD